MTINRTFKIKKILIPFDFSETAALSLDHAINMAKIMDAEIVLLHIVETSTFPSSISHAFSGFEKKVEEASNEKLTELSEKIKSESGVTVHVLTEVGKIYKKIASTAKQSHIDLIMMGTHGSSGSSYTLGSNTTRVVQEAHCPVMSFQTHANRIGFQKIILPIDDSQESRQKVPFAAELAIYYKAQVQIVGLMQSANEDYQRKFKIKIEQVEDYFNQHGVSCNAHYYSGDLAKNTIKATEELHGDLLVVMTEQESGLTGLLMGTYASKVINGSKIPVMTVRPAEIDPDRITVTF
jgi:nucleotide-binding universal stress UspA family protein